MTGCKALPDPVGPAAMPAQSSQQVPVQQAPARQLLPERLTAASGCGNQPAVHKINKSGQAMGRKGLESRERLLGATRRLIEGQPGARLTASAIAREAGLASQTFYLYFKDVDDVILVLCERASANAEGLAHMLEGNWRDEEILDKCQAFVTAFYQHWYENRSVLTYRNFRSDAGDPRFIDLRHNSAMPMVRLLAHKLSGRDPVHGEAPGDEPLARSVIFFAAMERLAGRPDHALASDEHRFPRERLIATQAGMLAQLISAAINGH